MGTPETVAQGDRVVWRRDEVVVGRTSKWSWGSHLLFCTLRLIGNKYRPQAPLRPLVSHLDLDLGSIDSTDPIPSFVTALEVGYTGMTQLSHGPKYHV